MSKWEYCAVKGLYATERRLDPNYPAIWYFTTNGVRIVEIRGKESDEVARAIAQLGEEGWEMVGCGNVRQDTHATYFKRPKP